MKDKLKGFFGGEEAPNETTKDETYYTTTKEEFQAQNGAAGSKMMLLEPRAYSESQQIADYLKNRSSVVVNLKRVTPDQAKRIVDFLYGTIYAIGGDLQKLGGGIFLCTPNNVNVEGTISEDINKNAPKGKKEGKDDEEDFF
jgi:cell division inhibitor SepF